MSSSHNSSNVLESSLSPEFIKNTNENKQMNLTKLSVWFDIRLFIVTYPLFISVMNRSVSSEGYFCAIFHPHGNCLRLLPIYSFER